MAPPNVIGRNTVHAIQSGLVNGYVTMLEGLVPKIKAEIKEIDPGAANVIVIATGGLIPVVESATDVIQLSDPWLTLKGLRLIADRN